MSGFSERFFRVMVAGGTVVLTLGGVAAPSAAASGRAGEVAAAPVTVAAAAAPRANVVISASVAPSSVRVGSGARVSGRVRGAVGVPTGSVEISMNGKRAVTARLATDGTFTAVLPKMTKPAVNTLHVRYLGSTKYNSKDSTGFRLYVQTLSTNTLRLARSKISYGDTLLVSAQVKATGVGYPTGRVGFFVAGRSVGSSATVNGVARFTLPSAGPGRYAVNARYSGSSTVLSSVGSRSYDVVRAGSSTDLVLRSTVLEPGARGSVTLAVSGIRTVPYGTATVVIDGVSRASVALSNGRAVVTLPVLAAGTHSVAVTYGGNNYYLGSRSATVVLRVKAAFVNGCNGAARACVDLTHNLAWLQENGKIVYGPVPMLSGRPGYRTTAGFFSVYWKDIDHKSSIFDSAPMPYAIFFNGGEAFHEGSLSVRSHGCIHLSDAVARYFWDALDYGDSVDVFGYAPY